MKMRPLGGALRAAQCQPNRQPASDPPLARPTGAPMKYAGVTARAPDGKPTMLALPAPLAARTVPLRVNYDGAAMAVADVLADGTVRPDSHGLSARGLAAMRPGVRIVAVTDGGGRVTGLSAVVRVPKPGAKPRPPAVRTRSRSADPYAVDPNELLISGAVGRVLRVGSGPVRPAPGGVD